MPPSSAPDSRSPEAGGSQKRRSPSDLRRDERRARSYALAKAAETKAAIEAKASERQEAWAATGHGDLTKRLSNTLDGLYGELREAHGEADARRQRSEAERQGWTRP